jgi:hypothetical protein
MLSLRSFRPFTTGLAWNLFSNLSEDLDMPASILQHTHHTAWSAHDMRKGNGLVQNLRLAWHIISTLLDRPINGNMPKWHTRSSKTRRLHDSDFVAALKEMTVRRKERKITFGRLAFPD